MTKKSIKINYFYNVSYYIFSLITPLITTPYLARILGADGVGTASYVEAIVSYFTLFATMGMTTFGRREISYVQDNRNNRTQIFWEINILELFTSIIALVGYIFFAIKQENAELYLVLLFNIISVVADISWFFQGMEEFGQIVFRSMIFRCINIIYIFLLVKNKNDIIIYLFGLSFFNFLSNVSLWLYLPKFIGLPKWRNLRPFRHIGAIFSLFVPTIAIQIYTVFDKTMIGLITKDAFEIGYYEQAIKMSKMILTIVTSLGAVMIPRVGYYYAQKNIFEVKQLMYRGYRFVWFLGIPLCLGLIVISDNLIPWFYGSGYIKVSIVLKILAFLILAIGFSNVTGLQYLVPTKREKLLTITVIIGAIVNFIMNLILIPKYQSIGAAVASVIAETTVTVIQMWIVRKELSLCEVFKEGNLYYIAGAIMVIVLYPIEKSWIPSILHTVSMVIIGMVVYFFVLWILKDKFFLANINSIVNKMKRKIDK